MSALLWCSCPTDCAASVAPAAAAASAGVVGPGTSPIKSSGPEHGWGLAPARQELTEPQEDLVRRGPDEANTKGHPTCVWRGRALTPGQDTGLNSEASRDRDSAWCEPLGQGRTDYGGSWDPETRGPKDNTPMTLNDRREQCVGATEALGRRGAVEESCAPETLSCAGTVYEPEPL